MKIYLVNLDKDTEKLAFMTRQLDAIGLKFERIPAVYGKAIPTHEFKKMYSPLRWWCAVGRPIVPAEVGCAYSHFGIYEKMQSGEAVCILEDDVVLDSAFAERLKEVERFVNPSLPQVIMLSSHNQPREGCGIVRSSDAMCTDAYVITRPAAEAILKVNRPLIVPCDHWWRWEKSGHIELYHALPTVAKQDQETFVSTTSEGRRNERQISVKFVIRKFGRFIGKPIDRVLLKVLKK